MADIMSVHEHVDPDAQATVTDFIDYTEYLPSDLERALSLVGKLDQVYETTTEELHELLKDYCLLPRGDDKQASVLEAEALRARISQKLNLAVHVREAAFVEASRLHDDMSRHKARLTSIHTKLKALPKPPSRDPTPQPAQSPQIMKRELGDGQRLKLRVDGARMAMKKLGGRPTPRVIVPGEVLPPRNPDSPTASMYDDFTSSDSSDNDALPPPPRPLGRPRKYPKIPKPPRIPKVRIPKIFKEKKERPPRPPRPPGVMGTNVHSTVAGISTSNALMLLDPPPTDAKLGSEHMPWMRLTEWEMAKLRKRMKKNAIWAPSDTMIRRELADAGRGPEAYYRAKNQADEEGEEFVDFDDLTNRDPAEPLRPGEIPLGVKGKVPHKGMTWNLHRRKKRNPEGSQTQAKVEEFSDMKTSAQSAISGTQLSIVDDKIVLKGRKRKRDAEDTGSATEESKANAQLHSEIILAASKPGRTWGRRSVAPPNPSNETTITTTTMVPLAAAAPSPKKAATPVSQPSSPTGNRRGKNVHVSIKDSEIPSTAIVSRPVSRQSSHRPSAPPESVREHPRRKSATPAPQTPAVTTSRLRNRRQAPGIVTNAQDGGAAVSIVKRKNAPRKKAGGATKKDVVVKADESLVTDEEVIDPNEETYCVCGGVSFGIMIMCENADVSFSTRFCQD